jgi:hypothetical protein
MFRSAIRGALFVRALHGSHELAKRYFQHEIDDIDIATFDLYCELGPSTQIIDSIMQPLRGFLGEIGEAQAAGKARTPDILLINDIKPKFINHPIHVEGVRRRLTTLAKEVQVGTGDVKEKQKLIDLVDEVRLESALRLRASERDREESGNARSRDKISEL